MTSVFKSLFFSCYQFIDKHNNNFISKCFSSIIKYVGIQNEHDAKLIIDLFQLFFLKKMKKKSSFTEVDEKDKISSGGGIDDEEIETVYVKVQDFEKKCKNMIRTPLLDFAYMWFLKEKWEKTKDYSG